MIINMNGAKAPETPSPVLQEKTVTPETLPTVIGADEGYDGLSQVTVNPDSQLKAENIRSGKTIFGVAGTFAGSSGSEGTLDMNKVESLGGLSNYGTFLGRLVTRNIDDGPTSKTETNKAKYGITKQTWFMYDSVTYMLSDGFPSSSSKFYIYEDTEGYPGGTVNYKFLLYFPSYSSFNWWDVPLGTEIEMTYEATTSLTLCYLSYGTPTTMDYSELSPSVSHSGVVRGIVSGTETSKEITFNVEIPPISPGTIVSYYYSDQPTVGVGIICSIDKAKFEIVNVS